ncbi:uncharacterized protein LOC122391235 [Amphibalanus amphitrite]|uniref:uncharacterized protein LOC122391235 n=1 Tax=Amphibalanus amphitrite TaxID=1232801 RepID=UPI001C923419|nr:uncharacterized protein LOC122391235 [Amphibalanus amphitrite]
MDHSRAKSLSRVTLLAVFVASISAASADPTTITIIHYEFSANDTSDSVGLMRALQRALEAYPGALLLNPTGHLGKRLWIQHDATAPNLADIVQRKQARPLSSRSDPLIAANIRIPGRAHVRPSTVATVGASGTRVGLVGFVSESEGEEPQAAALMVSATPPEEAVRREAQRIKGNSVPLVVALGNAGYPEDEAVAASVAQVDAVVAAHGGGDGYPVGVQQAGGKVVPLLRAPPDTVCVAQLMFGEDGGLLDWGGFVVPIGDEGKDA